MSHGLTAGGILHRIYHYEDYHMLSISESDSIYIDNIKLSKSEKINGILKIFGYLTTIATLGSIMYYY